MGTWLWLEPALRHLVPAAKSLVEPYYRLWRVFHDRPSWLYL